MYLVGYDVFGRNNHAWGAEKRATRTFNAPSSPTTSAWQSVNSNSQYSLAACMSGTNDWTRSGGSLPLSASGTALISPNPNPMKSGGWYRSRWNTSCSNQNSAGQRNTISTDCKGKDEGGWFWKTSDDWEAQVKIYMWDDNPSDFLGQMWKQGDTTKLLKDNLKSGDAFTVNSSKPLQSQSFNLTLGKNEWVMLELNKSTNPIKIVYNGATWIYTSSGGSGASGQTGLNWSNQNIQFRLSLNKVRYVKEGCMDSNATNYDATATIDDGSCYRDCQGTWGNWSACSVACGGGTQSRAYSIQTTPIGSGKACPTSPEIQPCNEQPCAGEQGQESGTPVNCIGSWGDWSSCSGGGQTRTYTVTTSPTNGGTNCPNADGDTEQRTCVDCEVSDWSDWGECVSGTISRTRTIVTQPVGSGLPCPELTETQSCTDGGTPTDCVLSSWGAWGTCTGGTQTRTRTITSAPTNGGASCGALSESKNCTAGDGAEIDLSEYIIPGAIAVGGLIVVMVLVSSLK